MIRSVLDRFVDCIISESNYEELDRTYLGNRIMALVGEAGLERKSHAETIAEFKDELVAIAVENGLVGALLEEQEMLGAALMDLMTPIPSQVNQQFWLQYERNPDQAIADFYDLSKRNDYIKVKAIAKNIYYQVSTEYGDLEITINLSKPEKDPKAIAAAKLVETSHYPKCLLCMENEGYQGRVNHPARANHRIIRLDLGEEKWGFQYSPYAYFNEHAIFLHTEHVPMAITRKTFAQLLDLVELLPGYFVGSNSDLPISGGSILTHNHYQGGRHRFAMEKAVIERRLTFAGFEEVSAGLVKWPMSVIRLACEDKERLVGLAVKILEKWRSYSDEAVQILASSNGEPHHTITPIARKKGQQFELDLVLRDNQTSEEFPDGIYHPHPDVQHIKKENIGLIEVMGLAILPPRLKNELEEVEAYLLGEVDQVAEYHQEWANELKGQHAEISRNKATQIVRDAVGHVFGRVLEDAGVYKRTPEGQAAFLRFVEFVGLVDKNK
ncbi:MULTISPECIES: UDP-glucose--hexose-1-phosphate uridylyltransferase [unclassified Streptococcus]|uniref:UDP-glucose--hexose-1-phosphate uridylyltransferase n=1 Tax=unclassified Streptococcus TaxID=2608887 RepID=UPI001071AE91|nr:MULTISPECIES: UDP-glucose--hexose-1-phosphate uridylyltransferase [unclassified Streptococcus]MBF0787836.1 UDP-glucose--hexose-1-phosphate uridylyltransferase [Streptococcus sp. 19428wC2_LYSM12]MCQ9211192.1 UDP-glucose--hexose-1-phosphate uridylyltransferase [Streptococcus sp. B01]MCQ9214467.1 UDP-glucose--hexose-1-phosphate uridylyltransferase [Streptococcus sp. O1]TFV05159.1 UDP-glucose--hexose-1-phosphate uridylyltransferase [Streptococcus sp. LYSM12]